MANLYQRATKGMQDVGRQIASNVSQGQKGLRDSSGKISKNSYGAINPLKGTRTAFMKAVKPAPKKKKVFNPNTYQKQINKVFK